MILLKFVHQIVTSNYPPDDYVRAGWWLMSIPILLGVLLYGFFTVLRNWRAPKRAIVRSLLLVLATVVGADLVVYAEDAYLRLTVKPSNCFFDRLPEARYEVRVCTTGGRPQDGSTLGFVQLRSTIDGSVLSEKAFDDPMYHEVFWAPDHVSVGVGSGGIDILLPPTRWDWFRAKLP